MQVHRSTESLIAAKQIDPSALPRELGGTLDEMTMWFKWCDERLALERKGPAAIEAHRLRPMFGGSSSAALGSSAKIVGSALRNGWNSGLMSDAPESVAVATPEVKRPAPWWLWNIGS